jgi:molybdopterin molybdotransferase
VLRTAKALPARQTVIERARGRILARAVAAPMDFPSTSLSAEDGFALRTEDIAAASPMFPVSLILIGESDRPGRRRIPLPAGRTIRVRAFDPLPPGADAVIAAEAAREGESARITVLAAIAAGENVLSRGSEIRRGESLLRRGHELAAEDLGLLATMGLTSVFVYPQPRVGIAFVGTGRVLPGRKPGAGEMTDGNLVMIGAALEAAGAAAGSLGLWPLETRAVVASLKRHAKLADVLVTTGGVSPHGENFLADCLAEAEGKIIVDDIQVTPGRACMLARIGKCLVVTLPGDPRGALVGLHLFVLPMIHRMSGRQEPYIRWEEARLVSPVRNSAEMPRLLPGRMTPAVGGGSTVAPEHERHLGSLRGVLGMNCFILLPPALPTQAAGARVKVARFTP